MSTSPRHHGALAASQNQLKAMSFTVVRGPLFYSAMTKRVMETFTHVSELNLVPGKNKVFGVDLRS